ncbi:DMSO/TMAO reductase YedYZ, molybdopterin-dependent catalytic subunit [Raineyella antarctica]|uniref:DMSO/TMAO reductase YedYZ, molybdopterin-dependent catalytic subunit n=1 Tax=Raineyella antarctica TaxID=1577474 RepID=A0A1G6GLL4_9ACTN|nr:DMSO/TMAO reductase YedYZ, molybdopterin-dependent catalytic subunit [Raineyella antarctica]
MTAVTAGITSAALGVAVGHLLAGLVSRSASPVVAVGAVVVDLVPLPLKEFAARVFGVADKAVLLTVVMVGLAALAGLVGLLGVRSRPAALASMALLGSIGTVAGVGRAVTTTVAGVGPRVLASAALPGLVATLVACLVLAAQYRRLEDSGPTSMAGAQAARSRRAFLMGSLGLLAGAGALGWLGSRIRPVAGSPVVLPPVPSPRPPVPAGLEGQVPGLTPLRTPVADFYRIDTALVVPHPDLERWRLVVDGMVGRPYELTLDDLLAMPLVERDITLTCVSNPVGGNLCGSTRWTGVLVADLLRRAAPAAGADMVLSRSTDGFTASTPLEVLLDGRDAMIALAMDGRPLTPKHGAPARLLTPGLYGYVGATKWLTRLTLTTFAADQAYWTVRGWAERGPVKTEARIDTPHGRVAEGNVPIAGVAWATHRGIGRVEVQVDGGPWQQAVLGPDVGLDYWRQWYLPWRATRGSHTLVARAYDASGVVQTDRVADVAPDGASGYPRVNVTVA